MILLQLVFADEEDLIQANLSFSEFADLSTNETLDLATVRIRGKQQLEPVKIFREDPDLVTKHYILGWVICGVLVLLFIVISITVALVLQRRNEKKTKYKNSQQRALKHYEFPTESERSINEGISQNSALVKGKTKPENTDTHNQPIRSFV